MSEICAGWIAVLFDWSLRWGLLILALMAVNAMGLPRTVAARLWLARLVLIGGLLVPLSPHWWAGPWPDRARASSAGVPQQGVVGGPAALGEADGTDLPAPAGAAGRFRQRTAPALEQQGGGLVAATAAVDWRVLAAWAWLSGCSFLLARQAAGWWWLARVRRAASPVCSALVHEAQAVRDELRIGRRVALLASRDVATPALLVGLAPAVVVPADWDRWSAGDRRAALLHELAHVAAYDDWSRAAEDLVRAAFFFHPLVRWLLVRLAADRELRCDAAAVRRGVEPGHLARLLLDAVRRLGPGRSVLGATPMFDRSSVKERIRRLLEDDMNRWSKPLSWPQAVAAAVAVLGLCAGLGGYGAKADPPPAQAPARAAAPAFRGKVSAPDGRRVNGATVIAVGDVGNGDRLTATTDGDGRFSFAALPAGKTAFRGVYLFAISEGFGPAITMIDPSKPDSADLTLPTAVAFGGVVKDGAGRPVAGANVQVGYVRRSVQSNSRGASWGYVPSAAVRGTLAEPFFFAATDEAGRFRFPALPADSELIFRVSAHGLAELDTGAGGPKEGQYVAKANAGPAELVLGPEAVIRGRVTSDVPGLSPDAAVVKLEGTKSLHGFHRSVKPAADGRFTAAGLPAGPIGIAVDLPTDAPATAAGMLVTTTASQTSDVQLKVIPGVEVTGRVVLRDTNEPVAGVLMATAGLVNPAGFHWPGKPTDAAGRFSLRLPPGKVMVMVWLTPGDYRRIDGYRQEIEVPSDAAMFEMRQPFELGKVVDVAAALRRPGAPAGQPAPAGERPAAAGPVPVASEREAAALIRQLGGWYVLDGDGHVVEVNMVYQVDAGGRRSENHLTESDGALRASARFSRLKRLLLHKGQATDDGLGALVGLADLEELFIWDATVVSDAGVAHLAGLPKLRNVHISNGLIGDGSLAIFATMRSIQSLSLQRNNFSDAGLKHLAGMVQLQSLWVGMSKRPITDDGVRHLAGLTSLERLDLQSERLTAAGVAALKDLTHLQVLHLSGQAEGGAIDDAGIGPLLGMTKLLSLSLGSTRLTADGVRRLTALPELRDLSLSSPAIAEEARENLKKERPAAQLRISAPTKRP